MTWEPPPVPAPVSGGRRWVWIVVAVVSVFAVFAVASAVNEDGYGGDGWQAHAQCAEFTRKRLRSPSTADFPEFDDQAVSIVAVGDEWTVRSFVDSENGFGASVRTSFVCVVTNLRDGRWALKGWEER